MLRLDAPFLMAAVESESETLDRTFPEGFLSYYQGDQLLCQFSCPLGAIGDVCLSSIERLKITKSF